MRIGVLFACPNWGFARQRGLARSGLFRLGFLLRDGLIQLQFGAPIGCAHRWQDRLALGFQIPLFEHLERTTQKVRRGHLDVEPDSVDVDAARVALRLRAEAEAKRRLMGLGRGVLGYDAVGAGPSWSYGEGHPRIGKLVLEPKGDRLARRQLQTPFRLLGLVNVNRGLLAFARDELAEFFNVRVRDRVAPRQVSEHIGEAGHRPLASQRAGHIGHERGCKEQRQQNGDFHGPSPEIWILGAVARTRGNLALPIRRQFLGMLGDGEPPALKPNIPLVRIVSGTAVIVNLLCCGWLADRGDALPA